MLKKDKGKDKERVARRVAQAAEPLAEAMGLELVDVELVKEGAHWYLRVFIDRAGGVDLESCQQLSRQLDDWLDRQDLIRHSYHLEVSSPGLERPLKKESDFARFQGRKALITTYTPLDGAREFRGELAGVEDGSILLKLADSGVRRIPFQMVASARLIFEF
ncbi:MAG: ribosome maturation factor RimP [Syntrophomonadaceae bacterium]|nr:ribosome maturation factor RimP [Syntrophomonadaceae bacterium]